MDETRPAGAGETETELGPADLGSAVVALEEWQLRALATALTRHAARGHRTAAVVWQSINDSYSPGER